jgi:hypothetical protein
MSLKNRILLPVIVAVLIAGLGTFAGISTTIRSMVSEQVAAKQASTEQAVAEAVDTRIHEYKAFLSAAQDANLRQAALFTRLPDVEAAYRVALSGSIDDEFDAKGQEARQMLRAVTKGYLDGYKEQTGAKNFDLHFHLPNSHSLLRVGQMDWQTKRDGQKLDISDDLSSFRPTVTRANRDRKAVQGIEVGRGGFAVRGVVPVSAADGSHLGTVEMLSDFNPVLGKLKSNDKEQFAVYMDAGLLDIATALQDTTRRPRSSRPSTRSPSRPTCWRSTPRSRPRAPARRARASPWSPRRCATWPSAAPRRPTRRPSATRPRATARWVGSTRRWRDG